MNKILSFIKDHKIFSFFSALMAVFLLFFLWLMLLPSGSQIYKVQRENLISTVLVNGTYNTASQTKVVSPTEGVITQLYVADNSVVKKGDKLFGVESTASESEKQTALASYLAAKSVLDSDTAMLYNLQSALYAQWKTFFDLATNSTYENSDKTAKMANRILPEFTTAQDNWLAAEANYKNQQGVIAKDQAVLSAAKQTYDKTQRVTVTAPADGTVINLAAKVNDQVTASTAEPPVLIIADFSNPSIVATVDQVNIPQLKIGQKASIVFDALPNRTFTGTVTYIDKAGIRTQGTTVFNVYVTAINLPAEVQLNMTATITVETARKENVLVIPAEALIPKGGKMFVELSDRKMKEVKIGLKGLTKVEIKQGLEAEDKVLLQL